jgi:hypothetical protein
MPVRSHVYVRAAVFAVRMLIRLTARAGVLQTRYTGWDPISAAVQLASTLGLHLLSGLAVVLGWCIRLTADYTGIGDSAARTYGGS